MDLRAIRREELEFVIFYGKNPVNGFLDVRLRPMRGIEMKQCVRMVAFVGGLYSGVDAREKFLRRLEYAEKMKFRAFLVTPGCGKCHNG